MKKIFALSLLLAFSFSLSATIHEIKVWNGYYQFLPSSITITLGDTIHWLPLDQPTMNHTITSTNIPAGAVSFNVPFKLPNDTFFEYVPAVVGVYDYVCTPHVSQNMVASFTVTSSTSVAEQAKKKTGNWFYPNPIGLELNIDQEFLGKEFQVFDLNGKKMYHGIVTKPIDVAHWKAGTYILHLVGDKPKAHRIVKLP